MIMSLKQKKIKFKSRIKWNHNIYVGVTTSRCLGNETVPPPLPEERSERGLNSHPVIVIISAPKRGGEGGGAEAAVVLPSAPSAQSG